MLVKVENRQLKKEQKKESEMKFSNKLQFKKSENVAE